MKLFGLILIFFVIFIRVFRVYRWVYTGCAYTQLPNPEHIWSRSPEDWSRIPKSRRPAGKNSYNCSGYFPAAGWCFYQRGRAEVLLRSRLAATSSPNPNNSSGYYPDSLLAPVAAGPAGILTRTIYRLIYLQQCYYNHWYTKYCCWLRCWCLSRTICRVVPSGSTAVIPNPEYSWFYLEAI